MSKGLKIVSGVLGSFLIITVLHIWLNIGFDKFRFAEADDASFRVGFLPVT